MLGSGLPARVIPEEADVVGRDGALVLGEINLSMDRWNWICWDDSRLGESDYTYVPVQGPNESSMDR